MSEISESHASEVLVAEADDVRVEPPDSEQTVMPDVPALQLATLRVTRLPGIVDGYELHDLSTGVTLIHGPNASGKSSTARAIEAVLWPASDTGGPLSVSATYRIGEANYVVDLDGTRSDVQRDGLRVDRPGLPAPGLKHRYRLSLHDLLTATDADFASEVVRQSVGGYDLPAAAAKMGVRGKPPTINAESKAVDAARTTLREAQAEQAGVHARAGNFGVLEARRDAVRLASAQAKNFARAAAFVRAKRAESTAQARVKLFAPVFDTLRGNEYEELCRYRNAIVTCEARRQKAAADATNAQDAMLVELPDGALPGDAVPAFQEAIAQLRGADDRWRDAERRRSEASARRDEARRVLGSSITDTQLAGIDADGVRECANVARRSEVLRAQVHSFDEATSRAAGAAPPANHEQLRNGALILGQWLTDGEPAAGPDRSLTLMLRLTALVAVIASLLLAYRWHPAFALLAVIALGLTFAGTRRNSTSGAPSPRTQRERDFAQLRLETPTSWAVVNVQELLRSLHVQLAAAAVAESKALWREQATAQRAGLEPDIRALSIERVAIANRLGVDPATDERQLSWLFERISNWQSEHGALAGAEAALHVAHTQRASALGALGVAASACGIRAAQAIDSVVVAAGALTDVDERVKRHALAQQRAEAARSALRDHDAELAASTKAATTLLATVGLTADADIELESLCARHAEFVQVRNDLQVAVRDVATARDLCLTTPLFDEALLTRTEDELLARQAEAEALAAGLESVTEELTRLREDVSQAGKSSDVVEALATLSDAEGQLRVARERDLTAMLGDLVVRHVQQVTRDQHRPVVFHRARELFAVFTRGRYRLDLQDDGKPTFRARDETTQRGHSLDELSSATRVQLLLAVRIAFVESQEQGLRLPLLMDELLGTSDDHRAQAIIDGVITLAEQGRQILYFTAQSDEVAKWMVALTARGVAHARIDLGAVRERRLSEPLPPVLPPLDLTALPDPHGATHAEYGAMLQVAPVRQGRDTVDGIPLWYLVEDVRALHSLMVQGIRTWGALRNLVENGGMQILSDHPKVYGRALALSRAAHAMHTEAAIGQERPVDRGVLEASEVLSPKILERVLDVLSLCGGSANALLQRLDAGEAPGLQTRIIDRLRAYLITNGYLDEQLVRGPDEIRAAMAAAVSADVASGVLKATDVNDLVGRMHERSGLLADVAVNVRRTESSNTPSMLA